MNAKQSNKLAMNLAVIRLLNASTATTATVADIAEVLAAFIAAVEEIQVLGRTQARKTGGVIVDKDTALATMAAAGLKVAGAVHAYAAKNALGGLAASVALQPSDFTRGRVRGRVDREPMLVCGM